MFKKRPNPSSLQMQNGLSGQRPVRLRRINHSDEVVSGFAKLLKDESMTDVTLICNGGQTIRAHRVILSTFSPYFRAIFEAQPFSSNPCQFPVIVIKDLGLAELRAIVEFIYRGDVSVPRDKVPAILQAAKALEVSGFAHFKKEYSAGVPGVESSTVAGLNDLSTNSSLASLAALESAAASGVKRLPTSALHDNGNEEQLKKLKLSLDASNASMEQLLEQAGGAADLGAAAAAAAAGLDANVRSLLQSQISTAAASGLKVAQLNQQFNHQLVMAKQQKQLAQLVQQRHQMAATFKQQMLQQHLLKHSGNGSASPSALLSAGRQSPARSMITLNGSNTAALQAKAKEKLAEKQQLQHHKLLQERLMQKSILNKHLRPIQEMHVGDGDEAEQNSSTSPVNGKSDILAAETGDESDAALKSTSISESGTTTSHANGDLKPKSEPEEDCDMDDEEDDDSDPTSIPVETRLEEGEPNEVDPVEKDSLLSDVSPPSSNDRVANGLKRVGGVDSDRLEARRSSVDKQSAGETGSEKENAPSEEKDDAETISESIDPHRTSPADANAVTLVDDDEDEELLQVSAVDTVDQDDDYDLEIDKDHVFQRQQQLRFLQLQKQQQYQAQLQIQLQFEEQEQKLMELNHLQQQLQAVATAAAMQASGCNGNESSTTGNGNANDTTNTDEADESGFGFDWQEGFIDSGYSTCGNGGGSANAGSASSSLSGGQGLQFNSVDSPFGAKLSLLALGNNASMFTNGTNASNGASSSSVNGRESNSNNSHGSGNSSSANGNNGSNGNGVRQAPDFLQPRGPGRPRKGNKTQDISPCPECNKIFVRPDVLKLHYRSVHLNERHPCNICPKIFKWPGDLSKHKRTKHPHEMAALAAAAAAAQSSARQLAKPTIKLS